MRRASPATWTADAVALCAVFLFELVISSFTVAKAAFARTPRTDSAIVAVPITLRTDLGIALLANLVTLTPGTCSLHVSADRRTLYVHALDVRSAEATVAGIKHAFERRIARLER